MKLGEALNERARLAKRAAEARDILDASLVVQEGEEPAADPEALLASALESIDSIETFVARINNTNANTKLDDGTTVTEALAHRDALGAKIAMYDFVIRKLTKDDPYGFRRSASELKEVRLMKLDEVIAERDKFAQERRELDAQLQTLNWTKPLL
jgi:hypothetical protein